MAKRISDYLEIDSNHLTKNGALDAYTDVDIKLYISPLEVRTSNTPEIISGYKSINEYFRKVLLLLKKSKGEHDALYRKAFKSLTFKEPSWSTLGYSKEGTSGKGIGEEAAKKIVQTAYEVVQAGLEEPEIFELVGLYEEGIGADSISDMFLVLLQESLLEYTLRIFSEVEIDSKKFSTFKNEQENKEFTLPYVIYGNKKQPIILYPAEILTPLPMANSWEDIDAVVSHNKVLREKLNHHLGKLWQKYSRSDKKRVIRQELLGDLNCFKNVIDDYREADSEAYDYNSDPAGLINWDREGSKWASEFPLSVTQTKFKTLNPQETVAIICQQFKKLVEANGLWRLLYNDDTRKPKREEAIQYLFFAIADAYCKANNLDIAPESHSGQGAVDFKFSRGYHQRILVEVKRSSNGKLRDGYHKQLKQYELAENTKKSFYLIV